jgi:hypothetical protein
MPIHDWERVEPGLFHDFHRTWTIAIRNALNSGALPPGYSALAGRVGPSPVQEILAVHLAVYAHQPTRLVSGAPFGRVIAVIEILTPGDKSRIGQTWLLKKWRQLLNQGIHLLVIDLFRSAELDPQGIHNALWKDISGQALELRTDKPLVVVAYSAGPAIEAYIEPLAVGDVLPEMPLFLDPTHYVAVPLETRYQEAWAVCPQPVRELLEPPSP